MLADNQYQRPSDMDNEMQENFYNRTDSIVDEGTDSNGLSKSKLVRFIKGNTSRKLQMEYKEMNKQFRGRHLETKGYFMVSSGDVMDKIIREYIKNQYLQKRNKFDNYEVGEK